MLKNCRVPSSAILYCFTKYHQSLAFCFFLIKNILFYLFLVLHFILNYVDIVLVTRFYYFRFWKTFVNPISYTVTLFAGVILVGINTGYSAIAIPDIMAEYAEWSRNMNSSTIPTFLPPIEANMDQLSWFGKFFLFNLPPPCRCKQGPAVLLRLVLFCYSTSP